MRPKVSLLGIGVNSTTLSNTLHEIRNGVEEKRRGTISLVPVHNLMAGRADGEVRKAINSSTLSVPDGMGTVWFLRLLGQSADRVYGPDLLTAACQRGQSEGWRHYFLGGNPEVLDQLIVNLKKQCPELRVAGSYSPPFDEWDEHEQASMLAAINQSDSNIVWVGLGSPRQELWMHAHRGQLNAAWLIGVGAAFDFLSGSKPQAPLWMQKAGLEWLFRLLAEPRRLWRRYANYPWFVILALGQWLGLKHYPLETED